MKFGKCACWGVSARDVGNMFGFCLGDDARLSSRSRGLLDGMAELVWYIGFAKDGEALRMEPFCMASICWGLANWVGLN